MSIKLNDLRDRYIVKVNGRYTLKETSGEKRMFSARIVKVFKTNYRVIALLLLWIIPSITLAYALVDTAPEMVTNGQPPKVFFTFDPAITNTGWEQLETKVIVKKTVVTFNASSSYDPDGRIVKYIWEFGDGEKKTTTEPYTTHIFRKTGTLVMKLTVVDESGLETTVYREIIVYPKPEVS